MRCRSGSVSGGATPASEREDRQKVGALGVVRDYMRDVMRDHVQCDSRVPPLASNAQTRGYDSTGAA